MLSKEIKTIIAAVASDKAVQVCCLTAMFDDCPPDSDLWEYLEEDWQSFSPQSMIYLWGRESLDRDDDEEDVEQTDEESNSLSHANCNPNEIIEELLVQVKHNILNKILR